MHALHAFVVVAAITACVGTACSGSPSPSPSASPSPSNPAQPVPASSGSAPVAVIDVRPLTITFQGNPIARLFADGRTEAVGQNAPGPNATFVPGPTLHADGTITFPRGGVTARVERSGEIYVVNPAGHSPREQLYGRISGSVLSTPGAGETSGIRVDDAILVFDRPGPRNELGKIEGTVDAAARHTALVMTAAFFIDLGIVER